MGYRAVVVFVVVTVVATLGGCATGDIPGAAEVLDLPGDGSHVLLRGEDWQIVVTPQQGLEHRRPDGTSGIGDYTRPITLTEHVPWPVVHDGTPATVVVGPVDDRAVRVEVASINGVEEDATLVRAHGLTWFWAVLPGDDSPGQITAFDDEGGLVDQLR